MRERRFAVGAGIETGGGDFRLASPSGDASHNLMSVLEDGSYSRFSRFQFQDSLSHELDLYAGFCDTWFCIFAENFMSTHVVGRAAILLCLATVVCPRQAAADFTPVAGWGRHLFPSFVIATAMDRPTSKEQAKADRAGMLGDAKGLFGARVKSPADNVSAKLTISGNAVMEPSECSVVLPKKGTRYTIRPSIKYKYATLARNKQSIPAIVTFRLELAGQKPEEQSVTITLRSINDCPFTIKGDDDTTDINFTFAAYVNEEHPVVDVLTKEALQSGIVESFDGYTDNGPEEVLQQVFALWHTLSKRGVRYSDASTTVAESDAVSSQHVRLLEESLNNAQANCVDGSVLFASLLRKIGLEPFLVLEPEHCYVGFYLDEEGKRPVALETTLLGTKPDEDDERTIDGVPGIENAPWTRKETWATFVAALNDATEQLKKDDAKFKSDGNTDYQWISITAARESGVLPIPYTASKEQ
jgi:hypothetical protein